jgi:sterol desaturase/sphingolipid hydroxylase (fatty acid hydroxylase superfamily)
MAEKDSMRLQRRWLLGMMAIWAVLFFASIIICLKTDSKLFSLSPLGIMLIAFAAGLIIERLAPAERSQPARDVALNIGSSLVTQGYIILQGPLIAVCTTLLLNRVGLGFITLPAHGWLLVSSAAAYLIARDFMEYVFHRAQHAFPFLWAMHSFHHSDRAVNITTAFRHFWFERTLHAFVVALPVSLLFNAPPEVLLIYSLSTWNDYFNHINVRLSLGPFWTVINGPQYHRIHHSLLPEHWNRNFAAHFPVFDIIFGTYYRPKPGEFPPTGLDNDRQEKFADAVLWPFRPQRQE